MAQFAPPANVRVFQCEWFGADAGVNANVAKTTAAIQEALTSCYDNGGGTVTLTEPGDYYINSRLVIYSDTRFVLGRGVKIVQYSGTNKSMLVTDAYANGTSTSVSLAWTAGPLITVTWTAHGFVRGDYCVISGVADTKPQYNSIFKIHSVTDANTFTVYAPRSPVASATGTPVGWRVTRNISIRNITFDYDYANNTGNASIANVCGVFMGRAAQFTIENVTVLNGNKYAFHVGAAMDYSIKNCSGYGPASGATAGMECLKHYGPSRNGHIENLRGRTTDDGTTVQPAEDSAFSAYRWSFGDIFNLTFNGVHIDSTGAQGIAGVYCDDNYIADQIYFKNVNGVNSASSNAQVAFLNRNTNGTAGIFGEVVFDGIHGAVPASGMRAFYAAAAGAISGRHLVVKDVDALSDAQNVYIGTNLTCDFVEVEDVTHNVLTTTNEAVYFQSGANVKKHRVRRIRSTLAASGTAYMVQMASGTPTDFELSDSICQGATSRRTLLVTVGAAARVAMRGCKHLSSDVTFFICQGASAGTVFDFRDNYTDAQQVFGFTSSSAAISAKAIAKNNIATGNSLGFWRLNQATNALTLEIHTDGNIITNAAHFATPAGTSTLTVYGWDMKADPIALTGLAATVGQYMTSTQAGNEGGLAVLGNVNGTPAWYALAGGAAGANAAIT